MRDRRSILPGSPTITATSSIPAIAGTSHAGPTRSPWGKSSMRIAAASTAPAMGQRASPGGSAFASFLGASDIVAASYDRDICRKLRGCLHQRYVAGARPCPGRGRLEECDGVPSRVGTLLSILALAVAGGLAIAA